jgi:predicted DNA-binding protein
MAKLPPLHFRVPGEWEDELEAVAAANGRTVSEWIRELIRRELDNATEAGES